MKVIKNINNNVSICIDDDGNELIAVSKGIGFKQTPYEIKDLSIIQKTYYNIDKNYFNLFSVIPSEYFDITNKILSFAKIRLDIALNPNIVMTLADHIQFMVNRYQKNLNINYSAFHDLKYSNPREYDIGRYGVKLINRYKNISLSSEEVYGIAFHFINSASKPVIDNKEKLSKELLEEVTRIIEEHFIIDIDYDDFNYSRFVTHINYLLRRGNKNKLIHTENIKLFKELIKEFPDTYDCVNKINEYFTKSMNWKLNEEEILYLVLHINRLCAHEDCNR